jgi:MFS family permease
MPLITGILIDKFGTHRFLIALAMFVSLGHIIFSAGLEMKSFPLMLMGRFCFGFGAESLEMTQAKITTEVSENIFMNIITIKI